MKKPVNCTDRGGRIPLESHNSNGDDYDYYYAASQAREWMN